MSNPNGVTNKDQRSVIDSVNQLNQIGYRTLRDPEISTKISQYEMAFRMQTSVPELMDVSKEPKHILDMYGAKPGDGSFASNCLLARRLAEKGVRFIHLYHRGWDHHGGVKTNVPRTANLVNQGSAALVQDLKQEECLMIPLLYGVENSDEHRWLRETEEITILKDFRSGWRVVELKVVFPTETLMNLVIMQRKMWSMSVIFMQRCSIN